MPVTDQQAVTDREVADLQPAAENQSPWQDIGISVNFLLVVMALGAILGHYSAIARFTRIYAAGM